MGLLQVLVSISFLFFTLPKLMSVYSEFSAKAPSYTTIYLVLGIVLLIAVINLFLGFKLFSKSENNRDKYFKYGLILIVVAFPLMGRLVGMASLSALLPIYNLNSQF